MRPSLLARTGRPRVPAHWPAALHPEVLASVDRPTPYLLCDLTTIRDRFRRISAALRGVECFYAMKCNAATEVLNALAGVGCGFEVASVGELRSLLRLGIDPAAVLYSNTVKPPAHIAEAFELGLWRYAFDSERELYKIARHAPGSAVTVRLRVDDSNSRFPLSRKFGAEVRTARGLMSLARSLGLRTYGVTFHVGSQCATPLAWRQAIAASGRLLTELALDGIEVEMLDLGGGFPARYVDSVPSLNHIGEVVEEAIDQLLPYRPSTIAAEPGRFLVAESAVMVASVLGREVRAGEEWLYLDVGAYNGLLETQQTMNQWSYPMWTSHVDHADETMVPFTVTGPSCDSSDTIFHGALLPATMDVGDLVYIGSAGAYTLSYATSFNGFDPPASLFVGTS